MNYEFIKETIFKLVGCQFDGEINYIDYDGVYAAYDGTEAVIGGCDKAAVARAFCEFAKAYQQGKDSFGISKKRSFKKCGAMLDVSREGVMRVERVKEYLGFMAALGLNMLMLYTEDIYCVEGYPYFGYQRGRYSDAELKEIDDYAYSLGIEVIPCIQTLGHMEKYLIWHEADGIRDTPNIMLADEESTYTFIEACIKTMRKCFRSNNIHIGMDEAVSVGLGSYAKRRPGQPISQSDIFLRHLNRVCEICKQYDYEPMMWSDLFFTMANPKQKSIFDETTVLSKEMVDKIPNVRLIYWYYSSAREERYEKLLKEHRKTGRKTAFAGTGWSFEGFVPNTAFAVKTNVPALSACVKDGTEVVINTLWGDRGTECSYFLCMPINALYAEYFYGGEEANEENAWEMFEYITKQKRSTVELMDVLNLNQNGGVRVHRRLLRQDVFNVPEVYFEGSINNFVLPTLTDMQLRERFRSAAEKLENEAAVAGDWSGYCKLTAAVMRVCADKCEVYLDLREAYISDDKEKLTYFAEELLPRLKKGYEEMYKLHNIQWERENKRFGWSYSCSLYGRQLVRIDYAMETVRRYLSGEISVIEELEDEILNQNFPD